MLINVNVLENTLAENEEFVQRVKGLVRSMVITAQNQENLAFGQRAYTRSPESAFFHEQTVRNSQEYAVRELFRLNREFCHGKLLTAFVDRGNDEQKYNLLCDFEDAVIKCFDLIT